MTNMPRGNPRIAPTAHFTAQAWVREQFPNSALFDTRTGRVLFGGTRLLLGVAGPVLAPPLRHHHQYLFIRHHVFEQRLRELAPDYVLEIGAGLSPRGLTFAEQRSDLTYVEVDLPHMVEAKRACLRGRRLPPNYHLTSVDLLADSFAAAVPVLPRPGDRIVVITEGVIDYLDMNEKRVAWRNIAGFLAAHGGGHYLLELHPRELYARWDRGARFFLSMLGVLVGRSFRHRLFETLDDALAMLRDCGFSDAAALDAAALNRTRHRPPMNVCPWLLVEANGSATIAA